MRYFHQVMLAGLILGIASWFVLSGSAQDRPKPKDSKDAHFARVIIKKEGGPSALDIHLDGKGRAIQFFIPPVKGNPRESNPERTSTTMGCCTRTGGS